VTELLLFRKNTGRQDRKSRMDSLGREMGLPPIPPGIKPYSWEPLGFLEADTVMD